MNYLERTLEAVIGQARKTFPAILLTGPRQSGKTTLLHKVGGRRYRYVSLEDPDLRGQARADPRAFLRTHPPPLILDEIQWVPELLNYVKTAIDEDRRPDRWMISGSQALSVMHRVSQSLAGRTAVLSLLPFSAAEAAGAPEGQTGIASLLKRLFGGNPKPKRAGHVDLSDWIMRGGFPEPVANPKVDRQVWCSAYVQAYVERDVRQIVNVGDLNAFERFLQLCAARTGQVLNMSDLARDTGISVPTAQRWLSVLEGSYHIFLLQPYFKNFGKRVIKAPKLYFLDTALATFLTRQNDYAATRQGPMGGALFETMVVAELVKGFLHRGERPPMYYWRSRDGLEVDLIVDYDGRLYPAEVKLSSTLMPAVAGPMQKWLALAGKDFPEGVIFADIEEARSVAQNVRAVPWHWI